MSLRSQRVKKMQSALFFNKIFFLIQQLLLWSMGLRKNKSEFEPYMKKNLISGYSATMVHETYKCFNWYLTLTEKKNSVSGYTTTMKHGIKPIPRELVLFFSYCIMIHGNRKSSQIPNEKLQTKINVLPKMWVP